MARAISASDENFMDNLVHSSITYSSPNERCPCLKRDAELNPYCSKNVQDESKIPEENRTRLNIFSVSMICATESHKSCRYYNAS